MFGGLVACREEFPKVWRRWRLTSAAMVGAEGCAAVGAIGALLAARLRGDEAAVAAVLVPMIAEHLERAMTSPGRSEQGREEVVVVRFEVDKRSMEAEGRAEAPKEIEGI